MPVYVDKLKDYRGKTSLNHDIRTASRVSPAAQDRLDRKIRLIKLIIQDKQKQN